MVRLRKDVEYYSLIIEVAKIAISEVHSFRLEVARRTKSVVMVIFCIRNELFLNLGQSISYCTFQLYSPIKIVKKATSIFEDRNFFMCFYTSWCSVEA